MLQNVISPKGYELLLCLINNSLETNIANEIIISKYFKWNGAV